MMLTRLTIAIALIAAPAAAARPKGPPPATPIGKPIGCVRLSDVRETRVRDDSTIDFYMTGGRVYRNTLPQSCPRLGFEEAFTYEVHTGELCSVDVIRVIQRSTPGFIGPACGLGQFQPVTGLKR